MSEFVRIDDRGALTPEDPEARARLAGHPGRFYLAPTSPDLLLGLRAPFQGGASSKPRVILAGDLGGLPLADLIGFLSQCRFTAVLRVVSTSGERAIVFKEGDIRGAASDDRADRIGEIVVRLGLIERSRLDAAMAAKPSQKVGRVLVDAGLLQPHQLFKALQHQVSEIFHAMLLAREGAFMLVDQEVEDRGSGLTLNTQGLLMDSIRRIDEMREFRKRIPSPQAFLSKRKSPGPELEDSERLLYDLCTKNRTLAGIAQAAHLSEFEATKLLYHLVEGGYVAATDAPALEPQRRPPPTAEEVAQVFNLIFHQIVAEVRRVGMAAEFVRAANAALLQQSAKDPLLKGLAFASDGTVREAQIVENASKSGTSPAEAARALKDALSELMFFLFFEASELLERDVDEDLSRRVKEMLVSLQEDAPAPKS